MNESKLHLRLAVHIASDFINMSNLAEYICLQYKTMWVKHFEIIVLTILSSVT